MMAQLPTEFTPIRIGAIVSNCVQQCGGCRPSQHEGQPPHVQPNLRFTLLLYVPVMESSTEEEAKNSPVNGGPFDPPIAVDMLQAEPSQATSHFLRVIGWN